MYICVYVCAHLYLSDFVDSFQQHKLNEEWIVPWNGIRNDYISHDSSNINFPQQEINVAASHITLTLTFIDRKPMTSREWLSSLKKIKCLVIMYFPNQRRSRDARTSHAIPWYLPISVGWFLPILRLVFTVVWVKKQFISLLTLGLLELMFMHRQMTQILLPVLSDQ